MKLEKPEKTLELTNTVLSRKVTITFKTALTYEDLLSKVTEDFSIPEEHKPFITFYQINPDNEINFVQSTEDLEASFKLTKENAYKSELNIEVSHIGNALMKRKAKLTSDNYASSSPSKRSMEEQIEEYIKENGTLKINYSNAIQKLNELKEENDVLKKECLSNTNYKEIRNYLECIFVQQNEKLQSNFDILINGQQKLLEIMKPNKSSGKNANKSFADEKAKLEISSSVDKMFKLPSNVPNSRTDSRNASTKHVHKSVNLNNSCGYKDDLYSLTNITDDNIEDESTMNNLTTLNNNLTSSNLANNLGVNSVPKVFSQKNTVKRQEKKTETANVAAAKKPEKETFTTVKKAEKKQDNYFRNSCGRNNAKNPETKEENARNSCCKGSKNANRLSDISQEELNNISKRTQFILESNGRTPKIDKEISPFKPIALSNNELRENLYENGGLNSTKSNKNLSDTTQRNKEKVVNEYANKENVYKMNSPHTITRFNSGTFEPLNQSKLKVRNVSNKGYLPFTDRRNDCNFKNCNDFSDENKENVNYNAQADYSDSFSPDANYKISYNDSYLDIKNLYGSPKQKKINLKCYRKNEKKKNSNNRSFNTYLTNEFRKEYDLDEQNYDNSYLDEVLKINNGDFGASYQYICREKALMDQEKNKITNGPLRYKGNLYGYKNVQF